MPRPASCLAAFALAFSALGASAQESATSPPVQPLPPTAAPPEEPPGPASAPKPATPAIRLVGDLGFDLGFKTILWADTSDGERQRIRANGGLFVAAGVAILPLRDGQLYTQASIGVKSEAISASNGSARSLLFPLEVKEFLQAERFRIGAGPVVLLGGSLKGKGALAPVNVTFTPTVGLALEADFVQRLPGARGSYVRLGPRFVLQRLKAKDGSSVEANAVGFSVGASL